MKQDNNFSFELEVWEDVDGSFRGTAIYRDAHESVLYYKDKYLSAVAHEANRRSVIDKLMTWTLFAEDYIIPNIIKENE